MLASRDWRDVADRCVAAQLSCAKLPRVGFDGLELVPLDIDVSVLEDTASGKEGVSRTYHNVNRYAPIFCYAGREGYMVACELTPGSQHCDKGSVEFLKSCIRVMEKAGYSAGELLLRVDSGHDASDFLSKAQELGLHYLAPANNSTAS